MTVLLGAGPAVFADPVAGGSGRPSSRLGRSGTLLIITAATCLVNVSYARSRTGGDEAPVLFWTAQLILIAYAAWRVLSASVSDGERRLTVVLYAAAQSLMRWAYSPHMFTFSDELQHYRSLRNVLDSHHLRTPNLSLPISPSYPGMENVTAALAQVSSASPFVSGVLIAGVAHILLAGCLLLLFQEITGSTPVASMGVLLYLLNPHAQYFDTSFHYETVALPFAALTVLFAVRIARRSPGSAGDWLGLGMSSALTAVTHNVSAFAAVGLLGALALASAVFRASRRYTWSLSACTAITAAIVGLWIHHAAPTTLDYLRAPIQEALEGLSTLGRHGQMDLPRPPTPLFDRIFSPVGVLVTTAILVTGLRLARSREPFMKSWLWAAAASYVLVVATRLFVTNGPEFSSRALTFTAILAAPAMSAVIVEMSTVRNRWPEVPSPSALFRPLAAMVTVLVLFLSTMATSLPEWWQRLPGRFWIDGFASGIDTIGISRAEWAAEYLPARSRFFGDITSITLLATLAQLDPIRESGSLYYTDELTPENLAHINSQSAIYLDVDLRMADQMPVTGSYFPNDIEAGHTRAPLDAVGVTKFDAVEGISRIYDSGYDRLYDLRWVQVSEHED